MSSVSALHSLDLRPLPRPQRHLLVFQTYEALKPGQAFELINDHDPLGLLHQFNARVPGRFTWDYRAQGPDAWRVVIGCVEGGDPAPHGHDGDCGCGGMHGGCG